MTSARHVAADAAMASIDETLASYEHYRREAWIEENLNHPGQMHVALAGASWFTDWEAGDLADEQAQAYADEITATVEARAAREFARRVGCWYCGDWARPGCQMHGECRRGWAAAKRDRTRDATRTMDVPNPHRWKRLLRSDGTGWGAEDEEGHAIPPPEAELVDGVGLAVGYHVQSMAYLK